MRIVCLIPIFDDWESAALLCDLIDSTFQQNRGYRVTVLLVDDGSFLSDAVVHQKREWSAIDQIDVLHLRRNVGHQRAIAVGLAYVEHNMPCDAIAVMDGDGEDRPQDLPTLLERAREMPGYVIFAERGRRPEGMLFRLLYFCYRTVHRIITGRGIRFGNFSIIPFRFVRRLTAMSEMWGHYAAAVINARIPYETVVVNRGSRLSGTSKMNLEALVLHGLSAVAVYQTVSVRLLIGSSLLSGLLFLLALGVVIVRMMTPRVFPGGTSTMLGICFILICLITFSSVLYVFTALAFRHLIGVLPTRDYVYFVDRCERAYPAMNAPEVTAASQWAGRR